MIQISKPCIEKDEIDAVIEVLKSGNLAQGKNVEEFEKEFSSYTKSTFSIATSSGTSALQIGIESLAIPKASDIITTPFTFIATANSIVYNGHKPVFADINPDTFNIDSTSIEEKITNSTKAILVVHLFGQPCEMDKIKKICKERSLILIEDCAQSIGAEYKGKKTGTIGDLGIFSFYATKNITTGEGGMITTNIEKANNLCRIIRNQGQDGQYNHVRIGFNERMTEVEAAIGRVQLKKLDSLNKKREENAGILTKNLENIEWLQTPAVIKNVKHSWHQYTIKVKENRDKFLKYLNDSGVGARIYYPKPINMQPYYRGPVKCPISERVAQEVISLPIQPGLQKEDLDKIIKTIKNFRK